MKWCSLLTHRRLEAILPELSYLCAFLQGRRLLMLKNPWNHLRWKGRFSENDLNSWTPDLQKTVNYDPKNAQTFDNGKPES